MSTSTKVNQKLFAAIVLATKTMTGADKATAEAKETKLSAMQVVFTERANMDFDEYAATMARVKEACQLNEKGLAIDLGAEPRKKVSTEGYTHTIARALKNLDSLLAFQWLHDPSNDSDDAFSEKGHMGNPDLYMPLYEPVKGKDGVIQREKDGKPVLSSKLQSVSQLQKDRTGIRQSKVDIKAQLERASLKGAAKQRAEISEALATVVAHINNVSGKELTSLHKLATDLATKIAKAKQSVAAASKSAKLAETATEGDEEQSGSAAKTA